MPFASTPSFRRLCWSFAIALPLCSCVYHQHRVGLGPTGIGVESARQYYFFFGLARINEVDAQRMAGNLTSYSITTEFSFTDLLLLPVLLPFTITSRTVTVEK